MEGTLLVTPEQLQNTASGFQAQASQVKSLHDSMLAKVMNLCNTWTGTASDSYRTKFNALKPSMEKIYSMISEHVRDLNEMAEQYINAENQAKSAAENLPASTLE